MSIFDDLEGQASKLVFPDFSQKVRNSRHAHWRVRKISIEMASEYYEHLAKNDKFYRANPSQHDWALRAWGHFTDIARATLATMLKGDYPSQLKAEIYEALVQDNLIRVRRSDPPLTGST